MKSPTKTRNRIAGLIIGFSFLFWLLLFANTDSVLSCHVSVLCRASGVERTLTNLPSMSSLMLGWVFMVFAMMLPKLISPIAYLYASSLKRMRFVLILLFISGYTLIWSVPGLFIHLGLIELIQWTAVGYEPAILVAIIALLWQFTPLKQKLLNRGHHHRPLAAFGQRAWRDAFGFGVQHGYWCVCSGWALMLFPMLLPQGHDIAMLLVSFIMISEHLERPQQPRWRFDLRLKLAKALWTQSRILGLKWVSSKPGR